MSSRPAWSTEQVPEQAPKLQRNHLKKPPPTTKFKWNGASCKATLLHGAFQDNRFQSMRMGSGCTQSPFTAQVEPLISSSATAVIKLGQIRPGCQCNQAIPICKAEGSHAPCALDFIDTTAGPKFSEDRFTFSGSPSLPSIAASTKQQF